jgi:putative spermidine/putrescine transport system substrate-binding protein
MSRTTRWRHWAAVGVVAVLTLAACSSSKPASTGNIAPVSPPAVTSGGGSGSASAPAAPVCQAVQFGPFTRCQNFYTAYWPTIEKNLQSLYKQAMATDGGKFVDWDWYELSPAVIAQFNKQFPGIKVSTRGLTYNLSSAIISAKATGARNTDIVSGSITSMKAMYDQGYWAKIDWTKYGVPKEFLTVGGANTGLLPDSFNGYLLSYNSSKVSSVPSSLTALTSPQWKGKLAINNYDAQFFSGYGMAHGQAAMVSLIKKLKSSGNLSVVNDTTTMLSTGDKPVALGGQQFSSNPALKVAPYDSDELFAQFSGLNTDASNRPAAILFDLWNAYDPTWLKERMTNPKFATSSMPYPGLPSSVFAEATGTIKKNIDAWDSAITAGKGVLETQTNRNKIVAMINAADKALNG